MILVIAEPHDIHARVVARQLELRGVDHAVANAADFPQRLHMSAHYDGGRLAVSMKNGSAILDRDDVDAVWMRRFRAHEISPTIADDAVAAFAYQEARDLFLGWIASVRDVINPRNAEWQAELKPFQLFAAQEVGLRIPRTLISNAAQEIRDFVGTLDGEAIFKVMSPTQFQFTATTVFEERHLPLLAAADLAPTIFQERIRAKRHLRITVVDDETFTASIEPLREEALLDWRLDRDPKMEPFALPASVEQGIQALRRRLGLRYGAIDMILDENGEYVFLEINPGGQFLFVEIHLGLPISAAIADALVGGIGRPRVASAVAGADGPEAVPAA
jgi:hypothetical protein